MAINRRATPKQQAAFMPNRVPNVLYSYNANSSVTKKDDEQKPSRAKIASSFFSYDTHLIFRDLIKTAVISLLIFVILGVTAWYLNR